MAHFTTKDVHGISRVFHAIDAVTARAASSAVVLVVVAFAVVAIAIVGFTSDLQYVFTTFAAAITLIMVFVIQHTQSRQQLALQIKLDELLRALPQADDRFVHIEVGSDGELQELENQTTAHHAALREDAQEGPTTTGYRSSLDLSPTRPVPTDESERSASGDGAAQPSSARPDT